MNKILQAFSHCFVINLDRHTERLTEITAECERVGLPFERVPGVVPDSQAGYDRIGQRGCALSHLRCLELAKERGYETVLILEDDCIFRPDFPQLWPQIPPQLDELEWDIFYGYKKWGGYTKEHEPIIVRPIIHTHCAHFWAIHSRFYDRFIRQLKENDASPRAFVIDHHELVGSALGIRVYCTSLNLAGQRPGVSAITGVDRPQRW